MISTVRFFPRNPSFLFFLLGAPEGDPSTGEDTEQEISLCIIQKGAGNNKVIARGKVTVQVNFSTVGVANRARNRGSGEGLQKIELLLLNLEGVKGKKSVQCCTSKGGPGNKRRSKRMIIGLETSPVMKD